MKVGISSEDRFAGSYFDKAWFNEEYEQHSRRMLGKCKIGVAKSLARINVFFEEKKKKKAKVVIVHKKMWKSGDHTQEG